MREEHALTPLPLTERQKNHTHYERAQHITTKTSAL